MYLDAAKKQEIFSKYGKSNTDTGSAESQIALFTAPSSRSWACASNPLACIETKKEGPREGSSFFMPMLILYGYACCSASASA